MKQYLAPTPKEIEEDWKPECTGEMLWIMDLRKVKRPIPGKQYLCYKNEVPGGVEICTYVGLLEGWYASSDPEKKKVRVSMWLEVALPKFPEAPKRN